MDPKDTPKTTEELLAALADGELDLRDHPEVLAQLPQDVQTAQQIARHQQLKQAVGRAMDRPEMKCPADLAVSINAIADEGESASSDTATPVAPAQGANPAYTGPPVVGRIGRWMPSAVAAVLLIAATVMFIQSGATRSGDNFASLMSASKVQQFDRRHGDCAAKPEILKQHERFGEAKDLEHLPGKIGDYFKTSTDGMKLNLSGVGYDYKLTGACSLPGNGAVHIVYRHHDDASRAISLWIKPAKDEHDKLKEGQVYSIGGGDPLHPVIFWRQGDLMYYLIGDSLEDCDKAVKELRQAA